MGAGSPSVSLLPSGGALWAIKSYVSAGMSLDTRAVFSYLLLRWALTHGERWALDLHVLPHLATLRAAAFVGFFYGGEDKRSHNAYRGANLIIGMICE